MHYRLQLLIWFALLLVLGLTLATTLMSAGAPRYVLVGLGALTMAALIMAFFMRLRDEERLIRLFALGGVLWVGFYFLLTLLEVLTR